MKMIRKKILIVDDDQENLQLMLNCLFEGGYQNILCATNGRDAIEIALREIPDLIIQDWDMPEISGIEVIRALGKSSTTQNIPVIIATGAMLESTDLEIGLASGAVDYIRKPYDQVELLARTWSALKCAEMFLRIQSQKNELKKQKEALEQNQYRLQTMQDASEEALVFIKDGVIKDVSDRYLAFTGQKYEDVLGRSVLSMTSREERPIVQSLENEEISSANLYLQTIDGRFLPCHVRLNPFSFNGDSMQVMSIQKLEVSPSHEEQDQDNTHVTNSMRETKLVSKIEELNASIENQNRQLGLLTLREFQINEFVARISHELKELLETREFTNARARKMLQEIIQEISVTQNDKIWAEFRMRFEKIHPDFYRRLLRDYPSLTESDLRIISFIKLNLTTKEIADLTFLQLNTIKASRKRIRQKLNLTDRSESLLVFLSRY